MRPQVSVIIPVYNERENLDALTARLNAALQECLDESFEVVFVDDGSRDGSSEMLDELAALNRHYRVIHLSRNFGHQAALQAGIDAASGNAVVLMDADLQDPPEVLTEFIAKWQEGFDVVYAIRANRHEPIWKRAGYKMFYRTMNFIADIDTPLDAGDFCLMDRRVVDALVGLRERNRFLRGLRTWVGFKQIGIGFDRPLRNAGKPKYTLRKLVGLAASGYVGFSSFPLTVAAWLGLFTAVSGFGVAVWAAVEKLTRHDAPQGWTSTIAILLIVSGIQLIILGVIGEYLGRVYDEVRQRPLYVVSNRVGFMREHELRPTEAEVDARAVARG
jgi:Glycosyltransferases involved in cell wall biogenesis